MMPRDTSLSDDCTYVSDRYSYSNLANRFEGVMNIQKKKLMEKKKLFPYREKIIILSTWNKMNSFREEQIN